MMEQFEERKSYWRVSVFIAIGSLIAAAVVCVIWVLVGGENGVVGRALLTILLLAAFAGACVFDAGQAPKRPEWYVLLSMVGWVVLLLAGAIKIWAPMDGWWNSSYSRFVDFISIVLIVRLAILHARLLIRARERYRDSFTRVVTAATTGLVAVLAIMLVLPLLIEVRYGFPDFYWRVVVAVTILAAVGTALVPLIKALNTPRRTIAAPAAAPAPAAPLPWPTYVDGRTPLPVMPDGSPDWNAYYTGRPTYPQHPPAAPGYPAPAQPAPQAPPPPPAQHPAPPAPPAGASPAHPD